MAGKIIADIIEAPYNKITLNVGNTVVATMNASGLYTSTGNLIITQANQIGTAALPAGTVLQVVQGITQTQTTTTSSSYVAVTNLSASITPTSATSKILVFVNVGTSYNNGSGTTTAAMTIYRNGSDIAPTTRGFMLNSAREQMPVSMLYLDNPSSTSALTYQAYMRTNSATFYVNGSDGGVFTSSTITLMEIAA
jgi:hypothetical protein